MSVVTPCAEYYIYLWVHFSFNAEQLPVYIIVMTFDAPHRVTTTLDNKDGSQMEVKMRYTKLPPVSLDPGVEREPVDNPEGIRA